MTVLLRPAPSGRGPLGHIRIGGTPLRAAAIGLAVAAAFSAGTSAVSVSPAAAQMSESARGDAVMNRGRPEYDPFGIPLPNGDSTVVGNTLIYPNLALSSGWSDNVYRSESDARSDFFTILAPSLSVASGDELLSLSLSLTAEAGRYLQETENDYLDFGIEAGGGYEALEGVRLSGGASWQRSHEDRGSPDSAQAGDSVTTFDETSANASIDTVFGDLRFLAAGAVTGLTFRDDGNVPAEFRDRTTYTANSRVGWEFQPGIVAFVQPSYNWVRYAQERGPDGLLQNNEGWQVLTGLAYDASAVSYAEIGVGYRQQTFDDPSLPASAGLALNAEVLWNATEMMTLTLQAERSIDQTTVSGASSSTTTGVTFGLDYELQYDLLFQSSLGYSLASFGDTDREDTNLLGRLGLLYLWNEYASAELAYGYESRTSDAVGQDFVANTVTFGIRLQY